MADLPARNGRNFAFTTWTLTLARLKAGVRSQFAEECQRWPPDRHTHRTEFVALWPRRSLPSNRRSSGRSPRRCARDGRRRRSVAAHGHQRLGRPQVGRSWRASKRARPQPDCPRTLKRQERSGGSLSAGRATKRSRSGRFGCLTLLCTQHLRWDHPTVPPADADTPWRCWRLRTGPPSREHRGLQKPTDSAPCHWDAPCRPRCRGRCGRPFRRLHSVGRTTWTRQGGDGFCA
jgi:hypothetical protein